MSNSQCTGSTKLIPWHLWSLFQHGSRVI